jgi:hypothetical protein
VLLRSSLLLPGQTYVSVFRFIAEVVAPEQCAIALIVNRAHDGNMRDHACRFAVSHLFSIGVAGVRHYLEAIYPKCSLCSLSHWLEAPNIRCIKDDSMCHDLRMLRVNCSLNVVRRESLLTYQHEARFRLWILLELL